MVLKALDFMMVYYNSINNMLTFIQLPRWNSWPVIISSSPHIRTSFPTFSTPYILVWQCAISIATFISKILEHRGPLFGAIHTAWMSRFWSYSSYSTSKNDNKSNISIFMWHSDTYDGVFTTHSRSRIVCYSDTC